MIEWLLCVSVHCEITSTQTRIGSCAQAHGAFMCAWFRGSRLCLPQSQWGQSRSVESVAISPIWSSLAERPHCNVDSCWGSWNGPSAVTMKRVGYWISEKKSKKLNFEEHRPLFRWGDLLPHTPLETSCLHTFTCWQACANISIHVSLYIHIMDIICAQVCVQVTHQWMMVY